MTVPPLDNISVSMAYEFPSINNKIKWIDSNEVAQCMTIQKLKTNYKTSFYKIYNGEKTFLFYNDKIEAEKAGNYFFDKKDEKYDKIGSIICDEISIEDDRDQNKKIARIILSISTYGYKFSDDEEEEKINNLSKMIQRLIFQQFEKRIKIELGLFFIKTQYNIQCKNKSQT